MEHGSLPDDDDDEALWERRVKELFDFFGEKGWEKDWAAVGVLLSAAAQAAADSGWEVEEFRAAAHVVIADELSHCAVCGERLKPDDGRVPVDCRVPSGCELEG